MCIGCTYTINPNHMAIEKSVVEAPKVEENTLRLEYTPQERVYYHNVLALLKKDMEQRDRAHDEFDGQTYLQQIESNKKGSNSYIEPKKNKEDTKFVAGTIRQKMFSYLAALNNLDLQPDIQAFDKDNNEKVLLGDGMEEILFKVGEQDNDEEKKELRQFALLEQGTVWITEDFEEKLRKNKKLNGVFTGNINGVSWKTTLKKETARCVRNMIQPENIYLGDIYQFETKLQPHISRIEIRSYEEAKAIYGKWARWKYVPRKAVVAGAGLESANLYSSFKFNDINLKDEVVIIKYQDKWNDEYQVMINGVMMYPAGFPLSAITPTGDYNIESQVLEPISPFFAFGKSLVSRMKSGSALLDEMYRMAILKTQKSFAPPMVNNTGRILSSKIFAPGNITHGIDPERLARLDPESKGLEGGEFRMLEMLQQNIDRNSLDPTYSGQQPKGSPTATQVLEVQRQAKMMVGLTVFACSQLEKKLAWMRIHNVLQNWFKPTGGGYDTDTGEYINKYRSVNNTRLLPGAGIGQRIVKMADKLPSSTDVMNEENMLSTPQSPVRIIYLQPKDILKSNYAWFVTVVPKERKTDALNKVVFDEFATKAMMFPNVNVEYLGERFAETWGENPAKMFNAETPQKPTGAAGAGPGSPKPGIPQNLGPAGGLGSALAGTSS